MTNKSKIYIGIGSAVALVGGYFIYKKIRGNNPMQNATTDESEGAKIFKKNIEEAKKTMTTKQFDEYLNKTIDDSMLDRYLIIQNNVKLYEYPSLNSNVIDTLPKCTILTRFDDMYGEREFGFKDWYRVKYKNKIGFVKEHMSNKRNKPNNSNNEFNNFIKNNRNITSLYETYQKLANCPPPYYNYENTKV